MLHRGAAAELTDILEFYFQALSTAMTSDTCAVGAATLASSGICPLTGMKVDARRLLFSESSLLLSNVTSLISCQFFPFIEFVS